MRMRGEHMYYNSSDTLAAVAYHRAKEQISPYPKETSSSHW